MPLYTIIGLNTTTFIDNSYETESPHSNKILHDDSRKSVAKKHVFAKYTIYIASKHEYYAIHLSESHCASFGGKLCTIGNMTTTPSNAEEATANSTHIPSTPSDIHFDINEYGENDVCVCKINSPYTRVFQVSKDGDDERTPAGFVYVNMGLFVAK
jgi:hypothetical protein